MTARSDVLQCDILKNLEPYFQKGCQNDENGLEACVDLHRKIYSELELACHKTLTYLDHIHDEMPEVADATLDKFKKVGTLTELEMCYTKPPTENGVAPEMVCSQVSTSQNFRVTNPQAGGRYLFRPHGGGCKFPKRLQVCILGADGEPSRCFPLSSNAGSETRNGRSCQAFRITANNLLTDAPNGIMFRKMQ